MTRGTLFYYESDDKVWSSAEFNGDMYHGTPSEPHEGDKVIRLMSNLNSLDDFKEVLKEINKDYGYDEGNDVWPVGESAIQDDIKRAINWIETKRPDLRGNVDMDPRVWDKVPTFKDVRTWKFWGTPNMSDYSYIYNNSGKDLKIKTNSKPITMIIPDKCLGVLNYGSKDCLCKNGKIIDGMGNYEVTPESETDTPALATMDKKEFYNYVTDNFTLDGTSRTLVLNALDYTEKNATSNDEAHSMLLELLDGFGLEDSEIKKFRLERRTIIVMTRHGTTWDL